MEINVPFATEVKKELESFREITDLNPTHYAHRKYRHDVLAAYLNEGKLPKDGEGLRFIGLLNVSLGDALILANQYINVDLNGSLRFFERSLIQFATPTLNYSIIKHKPVKFHQYREVINSKLPLRYCRVLTKVTESGQFTISNGNSALFEPKDNREECLDKVLSRFKKVVKNRGILTGDDLVNRCFDIDVFSMNNANIDVVTNLDANFPSRFLCISKAYGKVTNGVQSTSYTLFDTENGVEVYVTIYPILLRSTEDILIDCCDEITSSPLLKCSKTQSPLAPEIIVLEKELSMIVLDIRKRLKLRNFDKLDTSHCTYSTLIGLSYGDFWEKLQSLVPGLRIRTDDYNLLNIVRMNALVTAFNFCSSEKSDNDDQNPGNKISKEKTTFNGLGIDVDSYNPGLDNLPHIERKSYIIDDVQTLITEAVESFKSCKDNWMEGKGTTYKNETALSSKLASYLKRSNWYSYIEQNHGAGRSDIEVLRLDTGQKTIIECKRLIYKSTNQEQTKLRMAIELYHDAIKQVRHYTKDTTADKAVILFVCNWTAEAVYDGILKQVIEAGGINDSRGSSYEINHQEVYVRLIELPCEAPTAKKGTLPQENLITQAIETRKKREQTVF